MATLTLYIDTGRLASPINPDKQSTLVDLGDLIGQLKAGGMDTMRLRADVSPVAASGTVTIASGNGTITATINGVAIAVDWATSDTNTAALLAAAINASSDALVSGVVTATSALGVVTIAAVLKGKTGNAITLAASGTGATASGARLTGGSNGTSTSFVY